MNRLGNLQAEEAPNKQLDFVEAWDKAPKNNQNDCWDDVIDTAAPLLSASQSKARN